jgi:hypothetical protein
MIAPLFALAAAASSASIPVDTTLCAIVQNPKAFNGKVVRLRAGVLTDWHHGMALIHSGCSGAIQLGSIDAVPSKQSEAFDTTVGTPMNGGYERTAMATFTGRISWKSASEQGWFNNPLKLDAHLIESVKVYPRKQPR